ncbi:hypothetical protein [Rhizobium halophytocola]|uniref:Uncharacterized protein n=1 Tax=Rhizobium halophytocola TaxID=735519 RepID=A0ABS4E659_9HYPH|nr:hypothetical protein [Rhizobium halophytocola]MBP1853436.1 hypothetical protein [Rhizobium halophytocola]
MSKAGSPIHIPFRSYDDFVHEVYSTREDVVRWDEEAIKIDSFYGDATPGFYASFEAIMNQYAFLIRCIEGEETMDEAITGLMRSSWEATYEKSVERGMAQHPFFHLFIQVKEEAVSSNMLFGPDGRKREKEIANAVDNLKQRYSDVDERSEEGFAIDKILMNLDPFIYASLIDNVRYKFIVAKQIFNFPSRYRDALYENRPLLERMNCIKKYIYSPNSIGTPVSLFYENIDNYGAEFSSLV